MFHSLGMSPDMIGKLNRWQSKLAIVDAILFNILAEILPSVPLALILVHKISGVHSSISLAKRVKE